MGAFKKDTLFKQSAYRNKRAYQVYLNKITELCISMFEWKNLPETVDPRYLELALMSDGRAVFFKDEVMGYLALRCMIGGRWNVYDIPTERTAYAVNGYQNRLNPEDSVIIYNNMLRTPSIMEIETYAERLWDLDRTIDINIKAQKTPLLLQCNEKQRLTLINLYKNYDGNMPVIFADKNLDMDSLGVVKTDAPFIADGLFAMKTHLWNEMLTYMGISNISYQKRERLISDEVTRSQGGTIAIRYSKLNARRQACDEINRMFGLNISCDFREDYRIKDLEYMINSESEDGETNLMAAGEKAEGDE
ncbi:MAG: hypothetical protein IKB98_06500 [Clostridia bacterium]|nr:hypothetical protein [Clostridia bacterium]